MKPTILLTERAHRLAKHATAVSGEDLKTFASRVIEDASQAVLRSAGITIPQPKPKKTTR